MASTSIFFDLIARDRASDKFEAVGKAADGTAGKVSRVDGALESTADGADTTATRMSTLAGAFGDLAGGLGLIGLGGFSDDLEKAAPALMLVAGAADITAVATETLKWSTIKSTAASVANKTATLAAAAAQKTMTAATWALDAAMRANPIGLVITAVVGLVAVFVILYKKNEGFRKLVNAVWGAVKHAVSSVVDWIRKWVPATWDKIAAATSKAFDVVKRVIGAAFEFVKNLITRWNGVALIIRNWDRIKAATAAAFGWVKDKITSVFSAVVDYIHGRIDAVVGLVGGIRDRVGRVASGAFRGLLNAFKAVVNGIIGLWNSIDFGIHLTVPDWIPGVGGKGFDVDDIFPDIPQLARGGVVTRPTLAMIGEDGPEAVVPLTRKNAPAGAYGRGGDVYNITVNGIVGDAAAVAQEIERALIIRRRSLGRPLGFV